MNPHRTPDHSRASFARTNERTIAQRVTLLRELAPGVRSVAEVCGGDCSAQAAAYRQELGVERFVAVDVDPAIAAANAQRGLHTVCADALDVVAMRVLVGCDVVFFGPPLSEDCDGHRLLGWDDVRPGFAAFATMLLGELRYDGLFVCIGPRTTGMGDVQKLHAVVQAVRADVGLALVHHSFSSVTGRGERTQARRKYVELWFSAKLGDRWGVRESID